MIVRNFKLYLHAGTASPLVINVNQYDKNEQWLFTLYDSNNQKYTPSSGAIVGIKSDGLGIVNIGSVDSEDRVVINETEQMTAAVGKAVYELMIDEQTHGTANFYVEVEPKPGNNADLSESDLSLLQEAIDSTSPAAIAEGVATWMDENLTPTTPVVDASLTVQGAAADAKKTGDEISELKSQIDASAQIIQYSPTGAPDYNQLKLTKTNGMISTVDMPVVNNGVIAVNNLPSSVTSLPTQIGNLSNLVTTDKTSLVNAINEAASSGGESAEIYAQGTSLIINTEITNGNEVSY